jgi:ATP-dependent Clp protease ATP-binding subunit ClpA
MFARFTPAARAVVARAETAAIDVGDDFIGTEHLLLALGAPETGRAHELLCELGLDAVALREQVLAAARTQPRGRLDRDALASIGVDLDAVRRRAEAAFGPGALDRAGRRCAPGERPFTPGAKKSLELALRNARALGSPTIGPEHLLLGLLEERDGVAGRVLLAGGADIGAWRARLRVAA